MVDEAKIKIRVMRNVLIIGLVLTLVKFLAWSFTHSNAILTDALESIINIVAAGFGLFSLLYAERPRDTNHPYGHGKVEFFAVGFEGALIFLAGCGMIFKALFLFVDPPEIHQLNLGVYLIGGTAILNFLMGRYLIQKGKLFHSNTLIADGQHLIADTYSSVVLILGLIVILLTGEYKIDIFLTIGLGIYILVVGYRLLRNSTAGLMDETDFDLIEKVIEVLNKERREKWIDIHNLRVARYGASLHIDTHLTLPWYDQLQTSHDEVKALEKLVNHHFKNRVEFFIHTDPCTPESCSICSISNCEVRRHPFTKKLEWDMKLLMANQKHSSKESD